jgi:hypothetical protein
MGGEAKLTADPGGPYTVERGGIVRLDGSGSTGNIKSYTWTFTGEACGGIKPNGGAKKQGRHVTVQVLCTLTATLTVRDGRKTARRSVRISVTPRPWKRDVKHIGESRLKAKLVYPCLICAWGRNICALDGAGAQTSGHLIHPDRADKNGFKLRKIKDAKGPFDSKWYVSEYRLQVSRRSLINENLLPGTPLYQTNKNAGTDIDAVLASVRDHERLHTTLMQEAWVKADPGSNVEKMLGNTSGPLRDRVESAIRTAAGALERATSETRVKARMRRKWRRPATVLLPDPDGSGSYSSYTIPSLADVGDDPP